MPLVVARVVVGTPAKLSKGGNWHFNIPLMSNHMHKFKGDEATCLQANIWVPVGTSNETINTVMVRAVI